EGHSRHQRKTPMLQRDLHHPSAEPASDLPEDAAEQAPPSYLASQAAIARLAALACGSPMASLAWIRGHEFHAEATVGMAPFRVLGHASPQAHAITQPDEALTVTALAQDKRFAQGAFARQAPEASFFAGV